MSLSTAPPILAADQNRTAGTAHRRRVAVAAVELAKRLGWAAAQQSELQRLAEAHEHRERARESPAELTEMLELCCFFVQRWEYMPYEMVSFEQIMEELKGLARDGFFSQRYVEGLAVMPTVRLDQIEQIVARLPVFPAVALKAIEIARNPLASASRVEEIVTSDPVLAGEILRTANSPLFSPVAEIRTLRQAVSYMGIQACCRVLAAAAFRPMFQSPLVRPLWNHSLEVARLAEGLARRTHGTNPEEAFLSGLLHDVGRLALWKLPAHLASRYEFLLSQGCEPMFAETLLCGFDHAAAGARVVRHWCLPEAFEKAVAYHHQPERCPDPLPSLLYLAEHLSSSQEDLPSLARLAIACEKMSLSREQLDDFQVLAPLQVVE